MANYKDLVNNTFTDGIIKMNEAEPAGGLDALSTGLQQLKQTMINNYEPNKMKSQNEFNAICLLQLDNVLIEDAELIRVKARIPEVHSLLPIPDREDDYNKISLYPTFIGIVGDLSVSPTTQAIPVGTELSVTFDNTTNFGGPKIVRVLKMSPADKTPDKDKIPGEKLGRLKLGETPKTMVKIANTDKLKLRSGSRYGTEHMKQYLYNLPASLGTIYAADISDAAGDRRSGKTHTTPTFGGPLGGHLSHQSGIDVDLPVFIIGDTSHTLGKSAKALHLAAVKARKQAKKDATAPNIAKILKNLDVQRTFDFLAYTIEYAKYIFLHPAIVQYLRENAGSVTGHTEEEKDYIVQRIFLDRDKDGLPGLGIGGKAHSDHFHVRLKSRGYDDPAGKGKIWANYKKVDAKKRKLGSWTQEYWTLKGYIPLWSKSGDTYVKYEAPPAAIVSTE